METQHSFSLPIRVLGRRNEGGQWTAEILSANHNGKDEQEVARIRQEHPGEEECVAKDRVCSVIAVTRGKFDCTQFLGVY